MVKALVVYKAALSFAALLPVIFVYEGERLTLRLHEKNEGRRKSFAAALFVCALIIAAAGRGGSGSGIFALPVAGFSMLCAFCSGPVTGWAISLLFSLIAVYTGGGNDIALVFFLLTCAFSHALFFRLQKPMHIILRCGAVFCVSAFVYAALLFDMGGDISARGFLAPITGLVLNFVVTALAARQYVSFCYDGYAKKYEEINDPEYELLMLLKKENRDEYYVALHTAVLCQRVGAQFDINMPLLRCLGYYHRIGVLKGSAQAGSTELASEYDFPREAREYISEYNSPEPPVHTETVICMAANDIVSSIRYLLGKDDKEVDTDRVVDFVFRKKEEEGMFDACSLTMAQLKRMREAFKKEKLYYDFLR